MNAKLEKMKININFLTKMDLQSNHKLVCIAPYGDYLMLISEYYDLNKPLKVVDGHSSIEGKDCKNEPLSNETDLDLAQILREIKSKKLNKLIKY